MEKYIIISNVGNVFIVKRKRSLIDFIFGINHPEKKYKVTGNVYNLANHLRIVISEKGDTLRLIDPIVTILNNHLNKF